MAANSPNPSTAAEIVAAIARKQASALSVVQAAIERAERLTDLNSLISLHKDAAVTAAQKVDAARDSGAKLPALRTGQGLHRVLERSGGRFRWASPDPI